MQSSGFNLFFQVVIYYLILSNNCNNVFRPVLSSWSYSRRGATIYCIVYTRLNQLKTEGISGLQEFSHINKTVVLIFQYFYCLYLMYSDIAWVLVSSRTQVQLQIIIKPHYLPDHLSVSIDYGLTEELNQLQVQNCKIASAIS